MTVYLVARRTYHEEIIDLRRAVFTSVGEAQAKLQEISEFPEVLKTRIDDDELWFEIEDYDGTPLSDPIVFSIKQALGVLARTGVDPVVVACLLSDEYADEELVDYYDSMGCDYNPITKTWRIR